MNARPDFKDSDQNIHFEIKSHLVSVSTHLRTFLCFAFPQIAGSYRGSYFSMTGLLIPEIAKWS